MKKSIITFLSTLLLLSLVVQPAAASKPGHVTKGEFLTGLLDTMGVDTAPYADTEDVTYTDVPDELAPYLDAAMRLDIIDETEDDVFGANEKITREQAYVFLVRSLNLMNEYDHSYLNQFRDANAVSNEARDELAAASALDLVVGHPGHVLRPNAPLKAGDMADMLARYADNFDRISIVATNDMHGRILHNEENGEMGMARIAAITEQVRAANDDTFLFDIGDTFHGTNYVNFSEGAAAVNLMNAMGYDAMVLGNHDFNFGQERLHELMEMADFPVMSGNVTYEETGEFLTDPYDIVEVNGKEIALIAITAQDTTVKTAPANLEGLHIEYELPALQSLVEEVQDEVDHIFVLSHSGYDVEMELAQEIDGVDLILGGHSHTTLEYPQLHDGTYITQAWEYGKALSINHVLFYEDELVGINGFLARDHAGLDEEPVIQSMLENIEAEVREAMDEVIATIDVDLNGERSLVRTQETNLGNLITDAMRDLTGADVAFTNGGGIRDSISAGDVTIGDVITAFPFSNFVVEIEVTGADLLQSAEHGARLYPAENGGFFHVSGMSYTFDPSRPAGDRVIEMYIGGEPVDPEATYTAATNDFMASGGDGYEWLASAPVTSDTGQLLSEVLIDYLQREDIQIPGVEGRINVQ